jgi:hypothetical protein
MLAVLLTLVVAVPVLAFVEEDGTKNCGATIGYVHARYNDGAVLIGPGGTAGSYTPYDGLWHVQERNGSYSGYWYAMGNPYLDKPNTYAGCRNYG